MKYDSLNKAISFAREEFNKQSPDIPGRGIYTEARIVVLENKEELTHYMYVKRGNVEIFKVNLDKIAYLIDEGMTHEQFKKVLDVIEYY